MNQRNLAEALVPIGLKLGLLVPTVEAKFVDGKEPIMSVRGQTKNGNVVYAAGYTFSFKDKHSPLLNLKELGANLDGGLEQAWAFLGEVQESGQD